MDWDEETAITSPHPNIIKLFQLLCVYDVLTKKVVFEKTEPTNN